MRNNFLDHQYLDIVDEIVKYGLDSNDRTGTGTKRTMGKQIRHNFITDGLPIITSKKMFTKGVITELLWFLSGETSIKPLVDAKNYIWVGDCYKKYLHFIRTDIIQSDYTYYLDEDLKVLSREKFIERIKKEDKDSDFNKRFANIGKGYGHQWRNWEGIDQIKNAIEKLKNNPDDRKNVVSAWNVKELDEMLLEPCHFAFQLFSYEATVYHRLEYASQILPNINPYEYLSMYNKQHISQMLDDANIPKRLVSLHWNQRSADMLLGIPFNVLSYGLLLMMIGQQVDMIPYELVGSIGDAHVYKDQIQIYLNEQQNNKGKILPRIIKSTDYFSNEVLSNPYFILNKADDIFNYKLEDFILKNYQYDKDVKYPLSN